MPVRSFRIGGRRAGLAQRNTSAPLGREANIFRPGSVAGLGLLHYERRTNFASPKALRLPEHRLTGAFSVDCEAILGFVDRVVDRRSNNTSHSVDLLQANSRYRSRIKRRCMRRVSLRGRSRQLAGRSHSATHGAREYFCEIAPPGVAAPDNLLLNAIVLSILWWTRARDRCSEPRCGDRASVVAAIYRRARTDPHASGARAWAA